MNSTQKQIGTVNRKQYSRTFLELLDLQNRYNDLRVKPFTRETRRPNWTMAGFSRKGFGFSVAKEEIR